MRWGDSSGAVAGSAITSYHSEVVAVMMDVFEVDSGIFSNVTMNHPQMPTYVPMHQDASASSKTRNGFSTDDLWVSSSVRADRAAPLHPSQTNLLQDNAESASPLPRRELAPEGAAMPEVLRSAYGHPPPNGGGIRRHTCRGDSKPSGLRSEAGTRRGFLRMEISCCYGGDYK